MFRLLTCAVAQPSQAHWPSLDLWHAALKAQTGVV